MAVHTLFDDINSVQDVVLALKGGQQLVVCTPSVVLTTGILERCIRSAPRKGVIFVSCSPKSDVASHPQVHSRINLEAGSSHSKIVGQLKVALRNAPKKGRLFMEVAGDLPASLAKEPKQIELFDGVTKLLRAKHQSAVWFVHSGTVAQGLLLTMKDTADYFLNVSSNGDLHTAQFLNARGLYVPSLFLPRTLTLEPANVHLSSRMREEMSPEPAGRTFSDRQYLLSFDAAPEAIVLFEFASARREFNKRATDMLGYSGSEAAGLSLADLIDPGKYFHTLRSLAVLKKKGKVTFTTTVKRYNGREIDIEVSASLVGKNTYNAICTDISARVRAEQERQRVILEYKSFASSLPYPYAIFINRKLTIRNEAFDSLFPWIGTATPSLSEFFGRKNAALLKDVASLVEQLDAGAVIRNREILLPAPERRHVATEVSLSAIQYDGNEALYCTFVDVAERRQVLDAAKATEQKFRALLDGAPEAISVSVDGKFSLVNRRFADMFGWASPMELLGKEITSIIAGRNARTQILEDERNRLESPEAAPQQYEYVGRKKEGARISVEAVASCITMEGKRAVLTYHRDVTGQRKSEELLDRRAKGYLILNKIFDDVANSTTREELYHQSLHASIKATGFEAGASFVVDRKNARMHIHSHRGISEEMLAKIGSQPLDEGLARFFDKSHEPIATSIVEYPSYMHFKSLFQAEGFTAVTFLPIVVRSELQGVLLLATNQETTLDENDRIMFAALARQLSAALERLVLLQRANDADVRFHATVENISDVLYTLQPDGTFDYMSPNIETLLGYRPSDFIANAGLWRTLVHPDDRTILSLRISNQTREEPLSRLEYRILPKGKATYMWVRDSLRYERDASGELAAIHGILHDITDSHRLAAHEHPAQTQHVASVEAADILKNIPLGVAAFTNDQTCVAWNTTLEKLTRVAHDDVLGSNVHDLPVLREPLVEMIGKSVNDEGEITSDTDCELPHTDQRVNLHLRVVPWQTVAGGRVGTLVLVSGIADLHQLKEDITESEETLRNVIDAMGDALLISNLEGQVWEVNRAFTQLTGYQREEIHLKAFPYPWFLDEEMARFVRWIAELEQRQHLHDLDMTWIHKDGRSVAVSLNTTLLRNLHGEPMAILNIARDISERRKLALDLEWKNRQFELLNRIISHANTTADLDQIFEKIATEVLALVPYNGISIDFIAEGSELIHRYHAVPGERGESRRVEHLPVDESVVRDSMGSKRAVVRQADNNGGAPGGSQISIPLLVNENALGTFSLLSARPDAFTTEERSFLQPVADQIGAIIQRVRLFQQVRNDSTYIHNLLNSIDNVVYTVDPHYRITEVNKAWSDFVTQQGMDQWATEESIIGKSLEVLFPDATVWAEYKSIMGDLFARRIEHYSRDVEVAGTPHAAAYHLVINPMVIDGIVVALVFTHTDITEINRAEEELMRRNRELLALNAIVTSINKSLEVESVLRVAVEQLREAFDANIVAFYLLDETGRQLQLAGQWGFPEEFVGQLQSLDVETSLTGQVIATRKPVYITDNVAEDLRLTEPRRKMYASLGIRSSGVIPIQSKSKIQGAFMINFLQPHAFSGNEQQLLLLIGNQIGAAVENAQLYAEVQQQVNTLTTLYELGKGLTGALDLNSMLQAVYREVAKALPLDRFYYQAYFAESNTLSLLSRTVDGVSEYYPAGLKMRGLEDWPNTIYHNVVADGTSYMGSTASVFTDSMLAVPIKSNDKVIGIISIVSTVANAYKSTHLRLLESIANLTGVAIGKALLYEDTLKKSAELENRNKELDDFTYVVSHDLKEPLISIEGYSKIVMKDYKDRLDAEGNEYLGAVVQSTTRMKHLIEDLLTLSRLGRTHETSERVEVRKIVDEILHDLQFSLSERNVTVRVSENMPTVQFSGTRLSMVFRNLISNAMKFNDKPSPIINIGVRETEDEHEFFVADNGLGIEPQYFQRIFTIFQRLKRSEEFRGTGAGLTIAKKIVEMEGGRIWVTSSPAEGATFYFTIKKPA